MKRVPFIIAIIIASVNFISVSAQKMGDTISIADTVNNAIRYTGDSLLVYRYISQSKNYINKNPDSSLLLADLSIQIALQTNDAKLLQDAVEQKRIVQQANINRIKKQDEVFESQNETSYNVSVLLIILALILFMAVIYLYVLYRKKNIFIKELESSNLHLEHSNKELMQLQQQTIEKNTEIEQGKQQITAAETAKANTLKDSLISMLAHDIRSPLASLQHMLTLTRENVLNPEEFQKLSLSLEADIYNLRGILDNMLLWTREQMVEVKVNKSLFDLSEATQSIILMYRNSLVTKNITVKNYLQPGLQVFSDKDIVTAVLRNIFSNAVKFTEENRNIYISQMYFNKRIFLSVKDEGKGITNEVLEKINKGEHITTKGTSNEKGTGIGLMFTKDLLKKIDEVFDITAVQNGGTSVTFSISMYE